MGDVDLVLEFLLMELLNSLVLMVDVRLKFLRGIFSLCGLLLSDLFNSFDVLSEFLPFFFPRRLTFLIGLPEVSLEAFLVLDDLLLEELLVLPGIKSSLFSLRGDQAGISELSLLLSSLQFLVNVLDGKLGTFSCFLG